MTTAHSHENRTQDSSVSKEHILVALVRHTAKPGTDEKYVLDGGALAMLRIALLDHANDPSLPAGVVGLFHLAAGLFEEKSPSAALAIMKLLYELRPQLRAIAPELATRIEETKDAFEQLMGPTKRALPGGPAPEGAIKVTSLDGFRDQALRGGRNKLPPRPNRKK